MKERNVAVNILVPGHARTTLLIANIHCCYQCVVRAALQFL